MKTKLRYCESENKISGIHKLNFQTRDSTVNFRYAPSNPQNTEKCFMKNWLESQYDDSMCWIKLLPHGSAIEQLITRHVGLEFCFWSQGRRLKGLR